ncbi:MAG: 3' terminal RNA ribose 2'-O-methyltransferase Hen1 [Planctomycetes bacterium]|nr:3' terminal RNA ribose 2'-O-methyltransferase Hen1 [Planctomycetota bacterium]
MLLTITTTTQPATDLGFLLHKNPGAVRTVDLSIGKAHVFYPEANDDRCTAALMLEVDPVALVRGRTGASGEGAVVDQYVNDRPYAASSFLSVAIVKLFGTALAGRSNDRPELAASAIPLEVRIAPLPCRGGETILRRLFEPLGYEVAAERHGLDAQFPEWGESAYFTVTLTATKRLAEMLNHVYVLVPVLDDEKHYWVGDDELEKLLRHGEGWLAAHPERDLIARRYLKHQRGLAREALERLTVGEGPDPDEAQETNDASEAAIERRLSLNEQRLRAVIAVLRGAGTKSVVDLGCGEGKLLRELIDDASFERVAGLEVSHRSLERARDRLMLDRMAPMKAARLTLWHGSLTYRDARLSGFDAATLVEVIEHLDPDRLGALERTVFEFARPGTVVVTTPNSEFNVRFETLPAGRFRHSDHRFEWTRAEFRAWAEQVARRFGYTVRFLPIGPEDAALGAPTQMGVFVRG